MAATVDSASNTVPPSDQNCIVMVCAAAAVPVRSIACSERVLQCVANVCCRVLQTCVAVCSSVLQCVE